MMRLSPLWQGGGVKADLLWAAVVGDGLGEVHAATVVADILVHDLDLEPADASALAADNLALDGKEQLILLPTARPLRAVRVRLPLSCGSRFILSTRSRTGLPSSAGRIVSGCAGRVACAAAGSAPSSLRAVLIALTMGSSTWPFGRR